MYRETRTFQERLDESRSMLSRYVGRVPLVIEPSEPSIPQIDKRKFMVPRDLSTSQLAYIVRRRLNLSPREALFFFYQNRSRLMWGSQEIGPIYDAHKADDNFLYLNYAMENAFGNASARATSARGHLEASGRGRPLRCSKGVP